MEMHPAHVYWATHANLIGGESFFDFFQTLDPEIQGVFIRSVSPLVGARNPTYDQFKNACHAVVEAGTADWMLVHALVAWVLAWVFNVSNPDDIEAKEEWLRGAAKWFESKMAHADEAEKRTLESVHAQAHQGVQELTSNTLKNQKLYLRICEELVKPLVTMDPRGK